MTAILTKMLSKLRPRPKYSHVKSVNALFDQLNQTAPGGSDWLAALRKRALKKEAGWKAEADSYVHGLAAAGRDFFPAH